MSRQPLRGPVRLGLTPRPASTPTLIAALIATQGRSHLGRSPSSRPPSPVPRTASPRAPSRGHMSRQSGPWQDPVDRSRGCESPISGCRPQRIEPGRGSPGMSAGVVVFLLPVADGDPSSREQPEWDRQQDLVRFTDAHCVFVGGRQRPRFPEWAWGRRPCCARPELARRWGL